MNIESFTNYCLNKKGVTESFPFGGDTLVFKVMNKMFALTGLDSYPPTVNLKCDPQRAIELREQYSEIIGGFHMSKVHWNTVSIESDLEESLIKELIDHSYDLVAKSLKKTEKEILESL
jgi:predicted DNA-binding protein (MmcQ/YjbR family)